ncbi:hypothetical protein C8J56DRAFT_883717 [Mycena floridula]|nr:hypothetical protein C8J56DRAFT_883717 [Mycena floridula]
MLFLFIMQFQALLTVFPRSCMIGPTELYHCPVSPLCEKTTKTLLSRKSLLLCCTQFGILRRSHAYGAQLYARVSGAHSSSAPRIRTMIFGINISRHEAPAS